MTQSRAQFVDFSANADFLGPGAIEVNMYEDVIFDIVRRSSVALNRLPTMRATGQPHRYFEQTAIAQAQFTDPRALSPTPASPTRIERYAPIKAVINQTNITDFDKKVTEQQGQFADVVAKDIVDITKGIERARAAALWSGNDTSLTTPTTLQYFGLLSQISNQFTIDVGVSIVDGLKTIVAEMVGDSSFDIKPTAIYLNPVANNFLDQEAKAAQITFGESEVVAGVKVRTLSTQAGELPLVGDAFMPSATDNSFGFPAPDAGFSNFFAVILTEELIEIPYVSGSEDNPNPMLYQLGLVGNLTGQFVAVKYDCVIAKGASYAHAGVAIVRPTVSS